MAKGSHMHKQYSEPIKSFDRDLLIYRIEPLKVYYAFQRSLNNNVIRGLPDDWRVLLNPRTQEKFVSIIEIKTTNFDRLWSAEENAAVFQLQLYIWLMKPLLENLGYQLWKRHYLEEYSQKTGRLIKRVAVEENPGMDEFLRYIFNCFIGLDKMSPPQFYVCRRCPKNIREECNWHGMMKS
jgi:hypothetical protein